MKKVDFKKELKDLYAPSARKVVTVDVPAMNFLMIDGQGNPNTSSRYQQAVEALFAFSYTLKFMVKKGPMAIDYGVMPLEGLWWAEDMAQFDVDKKDDWLWTMMIMQPEFITEELVAEGRAQVAKKKDLPTLSDIRFYPFHEGPAAQTLHIGPFAEEGPTIERVHDFIDQNGWQRSGKHHEIYFSNIRRAAPEKWRTIIRQSYRKSKN